MALFQIPYPDTTNEDMQVLLDGVSYSLTWLWNGRDDHWYLSISLQDGTTVASGMRVVVGWDLLQSVSSLDAPPGELYFFDMSTDDGSNTGEDPRLDDLGARVEGFYVSSEG